MAVTIISSPDTYALTKGGRMEFQFSGSGKIKTAGSPAISLLQFKGPVADGTRIKLRWAGKLYELVARDNPSEANEFLTGDGTTAYVVSIEDFFKEFFAFREDFTCHASNMGEYGNVIVFTAKRPGTAYALSGSSDSANVSVAVSFEGSDPTYRINPSVYAEIWLQKPGTPGMADADYERVNEGFSIPFDEQNLASIDVGSILHSQLEADWPAWNLNNPTGGYFSHRRYFIAYGFASGNPQLIGRMKKSPIRHAYLGGADYIHKAESGFDLAAFVQKGQAAEDRALRFGSKTRYVRADEPQFLTFLNLRDTVEGITLDVYRKFDDNTTDNLSPYAPQSFPKGAKLTFGVGPQQVGLLENVPLGKRVIEYYVKIRTLDADYSEQYRFLLFRSKPEPYKRYFAFLNSLGVIDTVITWGKRSTELQRFYEQAQKYTPSGYQPQDGQFVDYDITLQKQYEVVTGFRTQAELTLFADFYRSPLRFELIVTRPDMLKVLPIGILSKSIKITKDGDTLFSHRFEYAELFRDEFFTEEDEAEGDGQLPVGYEPAGSVTIQQVQLVRSRDDSVPDVVRGFTPETLNRINQSFAWGNHANENYLKQGVTDQLYQKQYTPETFVPTLEIPVTNLKTYDPATKQDKLLDKDQANAFLNNTISSVLRQGDVATENMFFAENHNPIFIYDGVNPLGIWLRKSKEGANAAHFAFNPDGSLSMANFETGHNATLTADGRFLIDGKELTAQGLIRGRILIIGSSLAKGEQASQEAGQLKGWTWHAVKRLGVAGPPGGYEYMNHAVGGTTTTYWLSTDPTDPKNRIRLVRELEENRPEVLLIALSIGNEILDGTPIELAVERFLNNLAVMTAIGRSCNANVVLASPYPAQFSVAQARHIRQAMRMLARINVPVANLNALLDDGNERFILAFTPDGLHLTDAGYQELSWCLPLEYLRSRSYQTYPMYLDRQARGVRIEEGTARPIYVDLKGNTRSFTLAFEVSVTATAPLDAKYLAKMGIDGWNFRLRTNNGKIQLAYQNAAGQRVDLATSTELLSAQWLHVAVTVNQATQTATLYIAGKPVAGGTIPALDMAALALGGWDDTSVTGVGYRFRNLTLHNAPLEEFLVADLADGLVPNSSLLLYASLLESTTFQGMRFVNFAGWNNVFAVANQVTTTPNPQADVVAIGDLFALRDKVATEVYEVSRAIVGDDNISEGQSKNYRLIRYMSTGLQVDATADANLSLSGPFGPITLDAQGNLTVPINQTLGDSRQITLVATGKITGVVTSKPVNVIDTSVSNPAPIANPYGDIIIEQPGSQSFAFPETTFTDPGDTLTFSATQTTGAGLPTGISFNPATRTFTVAGDFPNGSVAIRIRATDSVGQSATEDFLLTIARPATEVSRSIVGDDTIQEGQAKNYRLIQTMSNGTLVDATFDNNWTLEGPVSGMTINGAADLIVPLNTVQGDTRQITLVATHKTSGVRTTKPVTVIDTSTAASNPPPQVANPFPDQLITQPGDQTFVVPANTFADNDALTWSAAQTSGAALPAGVSFNPATRTFTVAGDFPNGSVAIRLRVTDTANQPATDDFLLTVNRPVAVIEKVAIWDVGEPAIDGYNNIIFLYKAKDNAALAIEDSWREMFLESNQTPVFLPAAYVGQNSASLPDGYKDYTHYINYGDTLALQRYTAKHNLKLRLVGQTATLLDLDFHASNLAAGEVRQLYPDAYQLTADSPGRNAARADQHPGYDLNNQPVTDANPDLGAYNNPS